LSNQDRNNEPGNRDNKPMKFNFGNNRFALFFLISLVVMFIFLFAVNDRGVSAEIPYSVFLGRLESGQIEEVQILDQTEIQGRLKNVTGEATYFETKIPYYHDDLMNLLLDRGVRITGGAKAASPFRIFLEFLPWVLAIVFIWFMYRQVQGGGNKAFSFGKSKAKRYLETSKRVTFADVAGQIEAKYELEEVVDFLKNPEKFTKIGARIPTGVLLVGMPGTGKTLLAKAIAGEANVSFFHMSGSDFVEMFVGVGASRVRDLFEQGRKNAPCILFIDELDAVGRTRGAGVGGGHDEREQTLNQMLVEMDGFDTKDGVIILAATNRPDVLDPALLRPGRFDRQVVVDMPDVKEREAILQIHAKKIPLGSNVDLEKLGRATPGTSGADLANLVNEAALFAARGGDEVVGMTHFEEARDKLLLGIARKSKVITAKEKRMTSFHEAGHALLHYYLENADALHKVTVIPRGRALGMALSLPKDETFSRSRSWLLDRIKIAMGGFIAEQIVYGETTTGTQNDLEQATGMARRMVCEWGMSSELGPISYGQEDEPIFLGKEIARHKDYSEETAQKIDEEITKIVSSCLEETRSLLSLHREQLDLLAETLIIKETLDDLEIRELLGMPPIENADEKEHK
jgi:cell division protease FtsH